MSDRRSSSPPKPTFFADSNGIAAVEMAILAPVALLLLSLAVAAGQSLTAYHKVVLAAHTTTDLVARTTWNPDPNTANATLLPLSGLMTDIGVSQLVMYPEDTTNLQIVISEFQVKSNNNTGVLVWSRASANATALPQGTVINLDPNIVATGAAYIVYGQVSYSFEPFGGMMALPTMTLASTETLTIRNATQITIDPNN